MDTTYRRSRSSFTTPQPAPTPEDVEALRTGLNLGIGYELPDLRLIQAQLVINRLNDMGWFLVPGKELDELNEHECPELTAATDALVEALAS